MLLHKNTRARRVFCNWRRERDSNPRYALDAHTISNRAPSTTRPSLQTVLYIKQKIIFARTF